MAKILVVEDEKVVARDVRTKLESVGHDVVSVVGSGEEAIRTTGKSRPDLIIMDIRLAGRMDGIEAAEQIRAQYDIPVVYLTAYTDESTLERAKLTEPFGYIVKPFEQRELCTTVEIALYRHEMERRLRESEEKYRTLVEQSLEGLVIAQGPPVRVVAANRAMAEILGYAVDELISLSSEETEALVHPEDRTMFWGRFRDRLAGKPVPSRYEVRGIRKDGAVCWLEVSASRLMYRGHPAVQATFVDITERKWAQEVRDCVYRISEAAHSADNLEELFGTIHRIVSELIPGDNFYIALYDPGSDMLSFPYFVDQYDEQPEPEKLGKGLTEYVLRTGEPLLASPEVFDRLVHEGEVELIGAPSTDWLGVPLKVEGRSVGVLVVQTYTEGIRLGSEAKDLLAFVSDQVATAITRKQVEQALRKSEEQHRNLIDSLEEGVGVDDLNGDIVFANPALCRILGYSADELIGKKLRDIVPEDQVGKLTEETSKRGKGVSTRYEIIVRRKNGELRNASVTGTPWVDEGGRFQGTIGVVLDVTERKRAEEALRRSEERHRELVENLSDVIYAVDEEGTLTYVSPAAKPLYGYEPAKIVGRCFAEFVLPEDLPRAMEGFRRALSGDATAGDYRVLTATGELRWVRTSTRPVYSGGHVVGAGGVLADITARKQAEQGLRESESRFRSLYENATVGIYRTTPDGRILLVNPTLVRMLGYSSSEGLATRNLEEDGAFEPQYPRSDFRQRIERDGEVKGLESAWRRQDGSVLHVRESARVIRGDDGSPLYYDGIVEDITERRRAEELRESIYAISEATHSAESLDELFRSVHAIVGRLMPARNLYVALCDAANKSVSFPYHVDEHDEALQPRKGGKGLTEYVLRTGEPLLASRDLLEGLERKGEVKLIGTHAVGWLGVPLKTEQRAIGVLAVQSYDDGVRYTEGQKDILRLVSDQVAMAIERKRAEEALRESEEEKRLILENISDLVVYRNKRMETVWASASLADWVGCAREGVIGRVCYEARYGRDEPCHGCAAVTALQTGESQELETTSPKGKVWAVKCSPVRDQSGGIIGMVEVSQDITERKHAEAALRASEEKHRTLTEHLNVGVYRNTAGPKGRFIEANPAIVKMFGYGSKDEFLSLHVSTLYQDPGQRERLSEKLSSEGYVRDEELELRRKDGSPFTGSVSAVAVKDEQGNVQYFDGTIEDITGRKQTQSALKESEERFRQLAETAGEWIWEVDQEGSYTYSSPTVEKILGYKPDEVVGKKRFYDLFHPEDKERLTKSAFEAFGKKEAFCEFINRNVDKHGRTVWLSTTGVPVLDSQGNLVGYRGADTDITERRRAAEALEREKAHFQLLFESAPEAIVTADNDGTVLAVNSKFTELFGYGGDNVLGRSIDDLLAPEDALEEARSATESVAGGTGMAFETVRRRRDGTLVDVSVLAAPIVIGGQQVGVYGIYRDITERKRAEGTLRASEERYRLLFERNLAAVYRTTLDGRVLDCNETFARMLGYDSRDEVLDSDASRFYHETAEREAFLIWLKEQGAITNSELRLQRKDGTPLVIVENVSLLEPEEGGEPVIQGTMVDITARKRAEEQLRQSYERLGSLLEATVGVLASAVELRDPYTAGHQRGVTQLACSIAEEMGLSEDRIDGIRMAALIHDVGKIQVPAEILSKPGALTETQRGLIRSHPQTGHDVLCGIEFPWPVAQIVLQHHERMDGSGYPGELKSERILPEARVLAVADVVEAMTSHRPYREAFGVDKALEEISRNSGTLYDPEVVDACVRLFKEKGFVLPAETT